MCVLGNLELGNVTDCRNTLSKFKYKWLRKYSIVRALLEKCLKLSNLKANK